MKSAIDIRTGLRYNKHRVEGVRYRPNAVKESPRRG